jgi:hypothetical protein
VRLPPASRPLPCPRHPFRRPTLPAAGLAALLLLWGEALIAQGAIPAPPGFVARTAITYSTATFVGGMAVTPDGGLVVYDGQSVVLDPLDGSPGTPLFTPPDPPVFGDFLRIGPDGKSVYFGVNYPGASASPHNIYRIPLEPLAPGTAEVVDTIRFNYDLAFDDQGRGFVSSLEAGSENRIFLLDGDPRKPSDPVVVGIPAYSGPLAFHQGRLYYCTAFFSFPPTKENRVVYFTAEDLESGIGDGKEFAFQDAVDRGQVLVDQSYGYFNFLFIGDRLLASNSNGSLDWIALDGTVETFLPVSGTHLAYRPGDREFLSGLGPRGGTLFADFSDFSTFNEVVGLTPDLFFRRGYINLDDQSNIADIVALFDYLYLGGDEPWPGAAAGDVNDDGQLDISDPIFLIDYLFLGGRRPPEPFQEAGPDPTP